MTRTALIAGLGKQGVAIAYGLHKLGFDIEGVELGVEGAHRAEEMLKRLGVEAKIRVMDALRALADSSPDIVVSSLPFHLNESLAEACIELGLRYCDLGGNIDTSNRIAELAQKSARVPVMTDLGLAPGIANIIAELGWRHLGGAETIKIRVGGLPAKPRGTLRYGMTFSPQGLYNEYHDRCMVIENGERKIKEPLTDIEHIKFEGVGDMEIFSTSGGIANTIESMLARGVRECSYKTIRFPGHASLIRFLLFECNLDQDAFSRAMMNACGFITEDQVLMNVEVCSSDKVYFMESRVMHDENFTAMQKTTGFGAAAVAGILGTGRMDGVKAARYEDVPTEEFKENMKKVLPEIAHSI